MLTKQEEIKYKNHTQGDIKKTLHNIIIKVHRRYAMSNAKEMYLGSH